MRIAIEYQYLTETTRDLLLMQAPTHQNAKWSFGSYLYSENDIKTNPCSKTSLKNKRKF
jgi:hypothetical protein